MPAGLQIWDASGHLVLDTTTWCGQVLGSFSLSDGHSSGSMTITDLAAGRPFVAVLPAASLSDTLLTITSASVSGTTLSYTSGNACQIVYGIY